MARNKLNHIQVILFAIIAVSVCLGSIYVCCVPAGLPYDEPPHFETVRYYATHLRLPVLNTPGTNYEAYQAPLYYTLAAIPDRLVRPLGLSTEFYSLRLLGLALLIPLGYLAFRVTSRVFGSDKRLALLATAFICLNPALLGIASSIQNDMLSIVLSLWILDFVGRHVQDSELSYETALQLGVLISLAMLTKMSVIFFSAPIAWFVWKRHGRAGFRYLAIMVVTIALCTGWWFLRNKTLYGDLMGVNAMQKSVGQAPPHIALWKPALLKPYLRNFLAYAWVPCDYFRSLVKSSLWERSIVFLATGVAASGWWLARKDPRSRLSKRSYDFRQFLFVSYGICFAIYFYTYITRNPYPPRVLYPMFVVYAVFYAHGLGHLFRRYAEKNMRTALGLFVAALLLLSVSMCYKARSCRAIDLMPEINHFKEAIFRAGDPSETPPGNG